MEWIVGTTILITTLTLWLLDVAAHLRGMRPAPTSKKDTVMLRGNSNTNTINQTPNYLLLDCF